jgi:glutamine amidotransferase
MSADPLLIIDYGMGNLGSIQNMFKHLGVDVLVTPDLDRIRNARKLILAGVGAFDNGMSNLKRTGLAEILHRKVLHDKTPILGICLGMQLFTAESEEGESSGLGWIEARTIRFRFNAGDESRKIPHMGWNHIQIHKPGGLLEGLPEDARFYFAHSYHLECKDPEVELCMTRYGIEFPSAVRKDNVYGVQFHPEKSHRYGMRILENYARLQS